MFVSVFKKKVDIYMTDGYHICQCGTSKKLINEWAISCLINMYKNSH